MSIRSNYPMTRRNRKIDQAYEMAALARKDGDTKDAERWMKEVERLSQEGE